jgi:ATP-dependent 26S proteasome regulatory subunit
MAQHDEALTGLREAVRLSPSNVPLRQLLGDALLKHGLADEAVQQFREALALAPDNLAVKVGLARAFFADGKNDQALVLIEAVLDHDGAPASARVLYARLMLAAGSVERAVAEYKLAIEQDRSVADGSLEETLGIGSDPANSDVVDGRVRAAAVDDNSVMDGLDLERPKVTFSDVGGMDRVKEEVRMKIIHPLAHPEMYAAYGKKIGGGILMYGPPGCGKTHLARATAGEVKAGFISIGIHDVLDMWIGQSERKLHELFDQAREHPPCVLFFDEVDALGASRTDMRQSAGRQLINQFLSELDGVDASNEGVLVLAATNAPWHLDPAFRRPGRFDRIIFVPPPDQPARAAILRVLLKGKPVEDIDYDHIARKTEEFSGADLKAVVDIAVEDKLREAMKKGVPTPLTTRDLTSAAKQQKPTTKEWFATARNYALYSNQGGIYDEILQHLKLK